MDRKEANRICICRRCPSYLDCREEIAFCIAGKSKCIREEKGCLCPGCPVQGKMGFKHAYYCTRGSEKIRHAK